AFVRHFQDCGSAKSPAGSGRSVSRKVVARAQASCCCVDMVPSHRGASININGGSRVRRARLFLQRGVLPERASSALAPAEEGTPALLLLSGQLPFKELNTRPLRTFG